MEQTFFNLETFIYTKVHRKKRQTLVLHTWRGSFIKFQAVRIQNNGYLHKFSHYTYEVRQKERSHKSGLVTC